ncbi:MAG: protein translocase subunit SecD [Alphaproteobacteria bacterium]|nr:protein translocase subunit SecD [Alphaproteobacteria bacterium]
MVYLARWTKISIIAVCVLGLFLSLPNIMSENLRMKMPSFLPSKTVNLGLDLRGGSHLLLQVDLKTVATERAEELLDSLRPELREEKIGYRRLNDIENGVRVELREESDLDAVKKIIRGINRDAEITVKESTVEAVFSEAGIQEMQDQTMGQSIEIVRRRIDESGTKEPTIQRQGDDRILVQLPGLDNPEEIKRLLGTTAKLSFHLVDMDGRGTGTMTLPLADEPGQTLAINRKAELTGDMLVNASVSQDQGGRPAVGFKFNGVGAKKFCKLSADNQGKLFAIVLDKIIISAPRINEPICGGQGIITGTFTIKEVSDLSTLLRAGALPAPLTILEERTVGPSLGADSVEAGKIASVIGLVGVLIFMLITYGRFGIYAGIALIANVVLIFASLSSFQATLTLPGIAGIVLTIGMAVDANVLIFERIKEEITNGRSVMSAVDAGFSRAMSTIIDSNLTTLIAAVILYSFGTGPIKGFSVTLMIGILTSMFSAIMVTRLLIVSWLHRTKPSILKI